MPLYCTGREKAWNLLSGNGASVRPSSVVYDRADSSITQASAEEFDFDQIFDGAELFHVSGITPVLSEETARLTRIALQKAKEHDVTTSFDLNYRAKLWTEDVKGKQKMLSELMPYVDTVSEMQEMLQSAWDMQKKIRILSMGTTVSV